MSKYKLIMCDLDNTLLPMYTQEKFVEIWFRDIARKFSDHGLDPRRALEGVNKGVRAMLFNETGKKNIEVFFEEAERVSGYKEDELGPVMMDYYTSSFENVYEITLPNPHAETIARLMKEKARYSAIATMPVFTMDAVRMRMGWVGLTPEMFDFITTAETSSFSKPNPLYFQEILDRFGAAPQETLMIGNDVREDMRPCRELGIDEFLVTDHMITHDLPYEEFRHGTYEELVDYLERL